MGGAGTGYGVGLLTEMYVISMRKNPLFISPYINTPKTHFLGLILGSYLLRVLDVGKWLFDYTGGDA